MQRFALYINLFFIFFPAFSFSYPFTGIFFQSRILGLPFLICYILMEKKGIRKSLLILYIPLIISIVIPALGIFANRNFSLIDIGYILSFLYIILFAQSIGTNNTNINLFINYLKYFTIANIIYALCQILLMNAGLDSLAMIHCNVPSKVELGYIIPPSTLSSYLYRFSGLFHESSPLIFYLCSFVVFSIEINRTHSYKLNRWFQLICLIMISISDSKFAYAFLILLPVIKLADVVKIKYFKEIINLILFISSIVYLFYNYSSVIDTFSTLPAFSDRHSKMENSIFSLSELDIIGEGFVPSTSGEIGLDAISIVLRGYGVLFGIIVLVSFFLWILASKVEFKENFILVYILGLSSNGSLLISQYTLFFTMIYVINKIYEQKHNYRSLLDNNLEYIVQESKKVT